MEKFRSARTKGHIVNFALLWSLLVRCKMKSTLVLKSRTRHCVFPSEIPNQDEVKTEKQETDQEGEDSKINEMVCNI